MEELLKKQIKAICKRAESALAEYDRTHPHPTNEPADELTQRMDLLRREVNRALYDVCPQCSGMGKRQHDPGDEKPWVWICGTCKGKGWIAKKKKAS